MVMETESETYLAAFAVYSRITALAIMPAVATAVAVLPFVARLVAEDRGAEVASQLRRSAWITAGLVLAIAVPAGWLFPGSIAGYLLKDRAAAAGSEVTSYLALIPIAALVMLPFLLLRPVFEAIGAPRLGIRSRSSSPSHAASQPRSPGSSSPEVSAPIRCSGCSRAVWSGSWRRPR